MDSKILRDLCESYGSIYEQSDAEHERSGGIDPWKMSYAERQKMLRDKLKKKKATKEEVESWVESLIDEGYDLSEYTWEEMYEAYLEEQPMSAFQSGGGSAALRSATGGRTSPRSSAATIARGRIEARGRDALFKAGGGNAAIQAGPRRNVRGGGTASALTRSDIERRGAIAASGGAPKPKPAASESPKPIEPVTSGGAPKTKPAASESPKPAAPVPTGPKVAPTAAAKPEGSAMDQWAKANPKLAAAKAERDRTRGTSATTNPLMKDMKSRLPAPSSPSPTTASTAFSKSTPALATPQKLAPNYSAAKVSPSANVIGKKDQKSLVSSFEWGSTSKLVDDIANLYQSVYEAKKVDQDQDGDNDFADVRIARLIASGMSKEEAIAKVKNKPYNEETELDEATRMRKELGKEGEIATRKELARRSNAYKRSDTVDKTIAAAERGADRTTARNRDESEGDYKTRMQKRSQTLRKLAANRRKSVRSGEGLRGYAAKVEGQDRELQSARGAARSAGTLTNKEKKQFGEHLEQWVQELINEGYDLSTWTPEEIVELYTEIFG
jgi:hypothetical protein